MAELLLELFSEEIPARMQARAADDLKRLVAEKLKAAGLAFTRAESYATPRRLALVVDGLPTAQPDVKEEKKGPRVGSPQQAIDGFLKSAGLTSLDQCEQRDTGKGVFYFAVIEKKGGATSAVLEQAVGAVLQELPWPKSMRWADYGFRWVRPLHGIVFVFDGKPIVASFKLGNFEQQTGNETRGHRFLAPGKIAVTGFADYQAKLRAAKVVLDPAERRAAIRQQAEALAAKEGLAVKTDEALLDEVTGLVEWPVALMGRIDDAFMTLPPEVMTTTMRVNQKYFAVTAKDGRLAPRFVVIANTEADDGGKAIVAGNERVLRARLSDAQFFWEQDKKVRLIDRVPALDGITYHAKLGSVGDKVKRVRALAIVLSERIPGGDAGLADQAAHLAKADLVSGMVGEFPELQGVMGRYYARNEGLPDAVADAIADHYKPLGPGDLCPKAPVSIAVALADKIDSLVGFFAIDERPTGSKDPFALRRAALGVIRLILENKLRLGLRAVFEQAYRHYRIGNAPEPVIGLLMDFFADRLKVALREQGVRHDLISAVFALGDEDDLTRLLSRVDALKGFVESADGTNLLTAHKRAANIVRIEEKKDSARYDGNVDGDALVAEEERELNTAMAIVSDAARKAVAQEDFTGAMAAMAQLRPPVDAFFDKVTVNDKDPKLRANRLRMLSAINATLSTVADFSKIEG
ncbi:MAG TPA: glycine--tRNA ligase subunit beta [Dongiaceae bacterium]|nr:glycine--tRNA ligase subunit beta [Dongiaceae bacterium]